MEGGHTPGWVLRQPVAWPRLAYQQDTLGLVLNSSEPHFTHLSSAGASLGAQW